jgi:glyoxylate utilization-related uncharacterized protein
MNIETILQTQVFSQHKIMLSSLEQAEEEAIPMEQSIYILTGNGVISIEGKQYQLKCGNFLHIQPNTAFKISNPGLGLFNILLTQVATT